MHVAVDAMLLSPPYTGVQRYIADLMDALVSHVPDITLTAYVGRAHGWTVEPTGRLDVRRSIIRSRIRPLRICWEQLVLPFSLRWRKADLLHAPGYVMPMFAPIVSRKPAVLTVHDTMALDRPELASSLNAFHYGLLMPVSARLARRIIVPTRAVADRLTALSVPVRQIDVVPWGIGKPFVEGGNENAGADTIRALGIDSPFVLHVGRTDPKKNVEHLLKAFFAMKMDTACPHRLVLAGAPGRSHKKLLRLIGNLRMEEFVVFTGYVSDGELAALYRHAALVVCASVDEGFGFPPLEALASGASAIASDIPAFAEVLGDAVPLFDPHDLPRLRELMSDLLKDDAARRQIADRGRKRAERYSWERCALHTAGVYRRALRG